jgi:hypothetical protein
LGSVSVHTNRGVPSGMAASVSIDRWPCLRSVANDELSAAEFFDADRLADLSPERLARRVIHAAGGHPDTYLEHGTAPERDGDQSGRVLGTDE